jgi:SET family sugar efflux transporter-like MFS transporter
VTDRLNLSVAWSGVALGVAAALEIPALLLIGKLSNRVSGRRLLLSGCVAGVAYYAAMAFTTGPVLLLGLQVLNAWFFAAIAGIGLTVFQELIPRPALASGLYANTRRLGAVASGPLIGIGSATTLGYSAVFLACAVVTAAALAGLRWTPTWHREAGSGTPAEPAHSSQHVKTYETRRS